MRIPTQQEIAEAYKAMLSDMEDADLGARMGRLAAEDPMLKYQVKMLALQGMALPVGGDLGSEGFLRSMVAGALMYGMHLGICIGMARRRRQ